MQGWWLVPLEFLPWWNNKKTLAAIAKGFGICMGGLFLFNAL